MTTHPAEERPESQPAEGRHASSQAAPDAAEGSGPHNESADASRESNPDRPLRRPLSSKKVLTSMTMTMIWSFLPMGRDSIAGQRQSCRTSARAPGTPGHGTRKPVRPAAARPPAVRAAKPQAVRAAVAKPADITAERDQHLRPQAVKAAVPKQPPERKAPPKSPPEVAAKKPAAAKPQAAIRVKPQATPRKPLVEKPAVAEEPHVAGRPPVAEEPQREKPSRERPARERPPRERPVAERPRPAAARTNWPTARSSPL